MLGVSVTTKTTEWRDVPGFEGYYAISDSGDVLSVRYGRRIKAFSDHRGYKYATLTVKRIAKTFLVHRLVASAFIGPIPDGMVVCHNNGDCSDNRLENLRIDTQRENILDKVRHGTHHEANKQFCPAGHPFSKENTYHRPGRKGRNCRECGRLVAARRRTESRGLSHGETGAFVGATNR